MAKHVIFVIDISGSMRNRKLEQTKDALFTILKDMKEKNIGKPHMIFFQFSWFEFNNYINDLKKVGYNGLNRVPTL